MYEFSLENKQIMKDIDDFIIKNIVNVEEVEKGNGKFSEELWNKLVEYGLSSMITGHRYNVIDMISIINKISYEDASTGHFLATVNFCFFLPLMLFGSDEILNECKCSNKNGILAFTEEENEIETYAVEEDDCYVLNGKKHLIAGLNFADYALINALVNKEHTIFIVDLKNTEGVKLTELDKSMGMQSLGMWQIELSNVRVNKNKVLGGVGKGFYVISKCMELMRISNAAVALGIAQRSFDESVAYCHKRKVNSQLLFDMQYIKFELADMKAILKLLEVNVFYLAELYMKKVENQFVKSTITKYIVTEKAKEICDRSFQFCGGNGCLINSTMQRLYKEIRILTIAGGSSESLKDIISRVI